MIITKKIQTSDTLNSHRVKIGSQIVNAIIIWLTVGRNVPPKKRGIGILSRVRDLFQKFFYSCALTASFSPKYFIVIELALKHEDI
jgi:hypothetical protein